ncbi:SLBB domain-containing protein [Pseudomonadota bacterium]|nr:SLBB domain-containing protein [Pseudomonadota bacterium]
MNTPSFKTKITLYTRDSSLLILAILISLSSVLPAQDPNADLTKALNEFNENVASTEDAGATNRGGGGIGASGSTDDYKSFVQNELQNIFFKSGELNKQKMEDITFAGINEERIKLAVSLCESDQRACFLIDEYRSYKSKEDMPKEFEDLQLFGQDIFFGFSNEFNFYDSLPLDNDYILKIGDVLKISLFGGFSLQASMKVGINGSIIIPDVGEYLVAGLSYSDASANIKNDISNKYAGTEAYISLDSVRSKQIFVLGNVSTPGTYALNAFGTALNALISSGGVKNNSSLRNVRLVRKDNIIKVIDLYDLLIDGDVSSSDFVLDDGDSLLVGGLQSSVSIIGEVIRPAIYEIKDNETLADVISFALGTTPFADKSNISVRRLTPNGEKIVLNPKDHSFVLQNGDHITVNTSEGQTIQSLALVGSIRNAGDYSIENNPTLGGIIDLKRDLLDNTYTGFGVIKRLNFSSKSFRLVTFNLSSQVDLDKLNLYAGDQIFIFSQDDIKYTQSEEVYTYLNSKLNPSKKISQPLNIQSIDLSMQIKEEEIQNSYFQDLKGNYPKQYNPCTSSLDSLLVNPISNFIEAKLELFESSTNSSCPPLLSNHPDLLPVLIINSIPVLGNVRFPGLYPTTRDLNALEIFNLAGGVLVSKLNTIPSFDVGIRARGFGLYPYEALKDLTNISMFNLRIDEASIPPGYITLKGEFNNPGTYQIIKGTTLSQIYERAGGLTKNAYPLAGILTRESVRQIEQEAINRSQAELSEILSSAVASGYLQQNSTDLMGLIGLMTALDDTKAIGRLVTELNPNAVETSPSLDIELHDRDVIYIPKLLNTVTIVGQVLNPVTVPHKVGENFDYYLKLAGGTKKEADRSKIYVLQPNGVSLRRKNGFQIPVLPFMPFERDDILPGGTLVVPRKARPLDSLALVETITPVLANLSVTAASIAAISDN